MCQRCCYATPNFPHLVLKTALFKDNTSVFASPVLKFPISKDNSVKFISLSLKHTSFKDTPTGSPHLVLKTSHSQGQHHPRHTAGGAALGLSCAACCEPLAGVYASGAAQHPTFSTQHLHPNQYPKPHLHPYP